MLQVWSMFYMFPLLDLTHGRLLWLRAGKHARAWEHHGLHHLQHQDHHSDSGLQPVTCCRQEKVCHEHLTDHFHRGFNGNRSRWCLQPPWNVCSVDHKDNVKSLFSTFWTFRSLIHVPKWKTGKNKSGQQLHFLSFSITTTCWMPVLPAGAIPYVTWGACIPATLKEQHTDGSCI